LSEDQFDTILKQSKEEKRPVDQVLVESDLISDENLGRLLAEETGQRFINLRKEKVQEEALNLIPEVMARSKGIIAFSIGKQGLKVGLLDPDDLDVRHLIEKRSGQRVIPYLITQKDFQNALFHYKSTLKNELDEVMKRLKSRSLTREERDKSVVGVVDILLQYGYQNKASDIHIEPQRKKVKIRFRIDGILHEVFEMTKGLYELVLMRIKILAKMRTDEHRSAQDGKLRFKTTQEMVDVRVSVVPVTEGENTVMRILSSQNRLLGLSGLGLSEIKLKKVKKVIKRPHGMILVTGPTGCGKTTTLYTIMKMLNKPQINIATIEDPVEYDIEGVGQIQVNPRTNLTFAKGLRAIVRQDPDIIMVGEIRDQETAGIAVNSALTGHLVLSTLHTNDAATTLPRLLDMGVEPFLLASTVNIVIAQRLVRKICERCRVSYQISDEEKEMIESTPEIKKALGSIGYKDLKGLRFYKGKGCKLCGNTGFLGRVGVFEILEITEDIKDLIMKRVSSNEITDVARKNGMTTMLEDGIEKVVAGVTTIKEVTRVVRE